MRSFNNILVTGGAGFIGSHFLKLLLKKYNKTNFINLDSLTYAGNLENLKSIENLNNYTFVKGNIIDNKIVSDLFSFHKFDAVINLAAESHVDRSIDDPLDFIKTNIIGTVNLLNVAINHWKDKFDQKIFYHVSTDEVYGSLGKTGYFTEMSSYDPKSPYSSSKASSDHFVRAYGNTYGLNFIISNCSNNYGPNQFPEKLIPLFIKNIMENKKLPLYGDGLYTRDWLYVKDHVSAIDTILHRGNLNETYNIGGLNEITNIELVHKLCDIIDDKLGNSKDQSKKLISFVKDRPGHDRRYAIDSSKLSSELNWKPKINFNDGLIMTVDWYIKNKAWLNNIKSGNYKDYYNNYIK